MNMQKYIIQKIKYSYYGNKNDLWIYKGFK